MTNFFTAPRRFTQPQGPTEIDRSNPIARGLTYLQNAASGLASGSAMVGIVDTTITSKGRAWNFTGVSGTRLSSGLAPAVSGPFTFAALLVPNGNGLGTYQPFVAQGDRSQLRLYNSSYQFYTFNGSSWNQVNVVGKETEFRGKPVLVFGRHTGTLNIIDVIDLTNNNKARVSGVASPRAYAATALTVGGEVENVARVTRFPVLMAAAWGRALSDSELNELAANPWQLYQPLQRAVWLPAAGSAAVNLAAAARGESNASAQLLKGVSLAAASLGVSSAQASMTHAVPLAATATAQAASNGQITLAVTMSAASLSAALATAAASMQKTLSASGAATASATAGLQVGTGSNLSANASAVAQSGATLMLAVNLSAAALGQALATAGFATPNPLAAAGSAAANSSATLQLTIPLQAAAIAQATSGAGLVLDIPLQASSLGAATSTGTAKLSIRLQADANSNATAYAALSAGATSSLHATRGYSAKSCGRAWRASRLGGRNYAASAIGRKWSANA